MFYITNQGKERVTSPNVRCEAVIAEWLLSHSLTSASEYIIVDDPECDQFFKFNAVEEAPLDDFIYNSIG